MILHIVTTAETCTACLPGTSRLARRHALNHDPNSPLEFDFELASKTYILFLRFNYRKIGTLN